MLAICETIFLGSDVSYPSPNQVLKLFMGELPKNKGADWMKRNKQLRFITLRSFRIALKLALDHTLVGPSNNSWIDLQMALEEYTRDWFVGPDDSSDCIGNDEENFKVPVTWDQAIRKEAPSLFSIGYNDIKVCRYEYKLIIGIL